MSKEENQKLEKNEDVKVDEKESTENLITQESYYILNDKYLRLVAEFDNYKRRTQKEKQAYIESGKTQTSLHLIQLLDDFNRAGELSDGMSLIKKKIENILNSYNVKKIKSIDEKFDPEYHEALSQMPIDGKKGIVVDVMEDGYTIDDKILRYSKVVVGR